jgi:putative nucleotidyltransferase with HDIG domain
MSPRLLRKANQVNKELWLLLSLFGIAALLNFFTASNHVILGFYALPTVFSAYHYGRRHAVMTSLASAAIVVLLTFFNPQIGAPNLVPPSMQAWFDIAAWGAILLITAYAMGSLYEHKQDQVDELRTTYQGVLTILSHFISNDKYTHNHSYRVSMYAATIAQQMGLSISQVEDIRAAALLHDIGKLEISRDILYKAARLTDDEKAHVDEHVDHSGTILRPFGGSLQRIIPIVLAHHDKFDGTGHNGLEGENIPLEARIISVADVWDAITSDRPYRKAMSPFEAKEIIEKGRGKDFDPEVVDSFLIAFRRGKMELTEAVMLQ